MLFYYNNIFIRSYLVHSTVKYCFIQSGFGFSLSKTKFLANVAIFFSVMISFIANRKKIFL